MLENLQISICTVITVSLLQYNICSHICRSSEKSQRHLMSKTKFWWKVRALREKIPFVHIFIEFRISTGRRLYRTEAETLRYTALLLFQLSALPVTMKWNSKLSVEAALSFAVAFCLILERHLVRISVRISIIMAANVLPFFSQSRQIPRQCLGLGSSRFLSHPSQFIIHYLTHFDAEYQVVGTSLSTLRSPPSLSVCVCVIYIYNSQYHYTICRALALYEVVWLQQTLVSACRFYRVIPD